MSEFSIREATSEDKQAVLDCHRNVYNGNDYLPEFYDYFMTSKFAKSFVLLDDKHIIGFNTGCLVDDGQTMVSRAARISPGYEGKGLYRLLDEHVSNWAKSRDVTTKAQTTTERNSVITKPSFLEKNKLLVTRNALMYTFKKSTLDKIKKPDDWSSPIRLVEEDVLREYITSRVISKYLFPHDRVIVDFLPYKLLSSNVTLMREPLNFTETLTDFRIDETGQPKGLLTFGSMYKVPAFSCIYSIDIYGSNTESFERHIQMHLSRLKAKASSTTAVDLFFYESFPLEKVDQVLRAYGGVCDEGYFRHQFLFEKQL